jgi:pyrroline-5-carboxylate reductase
MNHKIQSIGVIGLGKMGSAIAESLAKKNQKVFGFDPFPPKDLPHTIQLKNTLEDLIETCDCLVVAVKPNLVSSVLREVKTPKIILSIAAGISYDALASASPKDSIIIRVMPNLPLVVGRGAIGYFSNSDVDSLVFSIFSGMGVCVKLTKESLLDSVTGLSGSGPAYVLTFLQSLTEAGLKEGLSFEEALALSMETIEGTIVYFRELRKVDSHLHPMEVRNWVTSPGGTTIHGLDALERGGFATSVRDAVRAASERSRELGRG